MSENEWTKILGWPCYTRTREGKLGLSLRANEEAKTLRLWVRRTRENRSLVCSGCGRGIDEIAASTSGGYGTCRGQAEKFYRALAGQKVRMGMEASGHAR
jgi:hypothetical protein